MQFCANIVGMDPVINKLLIGLISRHQNRKKETMMRARKS